jgi:hypothetical protein
MRGVTQTALITGERVDIVTGTEILWTGISRFSGDTAAAYDCGVTSDWLIGSPRLLAYHSFDEIPEFIEGCQRRVGFEDVTRRVGVLSEDAL